MKSYRETIRSLMEETFNKSLLVEANLATTFEEYITNVWNATLGKKVPTTGPIPGFEGEENQKWATNVYKIVAEMRKVMKTKAQMVHSGSDSAEISDFYRSHGGVDNTPKADIRTSDNKYRLSLKEAGGSQLMSGKKSDTLPVFKAAEKNFNEKSNVPEELNNDIKKWATELADFMDILKFKDMENIFLNDKAEDTYNKNKGEFEVVGKGGKVKKSLEINNKFFTHLGEIVLLANTQKLRKFLSPEFNEFLDDVLAKDKVMKNVMSQRFSEFFSNNPQFLQLFVYEAASGKDKFTGIDPVSNSFLVFSVGGDVVLKKFENHETDVITDLASKVKIRFRWKHGTGVALAVDLTKEGEGDEQHTENFYSFLDEQVEEFNNNLINEGINDFFSKIGSFIKNLATNIYNKLKSLVERGIEYIYKFFGLDVEDVEVVTNPTITF